MENNITNNKKDILQGMRVMEARRRQQWEQQRTKHKNKKA